MKYGIILYSYTGNTLSVGKRLETEFLEAGKSVNLEQVTTSDQNPTKSTDIQLNNIPDSDKYDFIIFACPVWAFSASKVFEKYLTGISSLKGKKIEIFVTHHFPFAFMGGNHSVRQLKQICQSKGAEIVKTGVINWSGKTRAQQVVELIKNFTDIKE